MLQDIATLLLTGFRAPGEAVRIPFAQTIIRDRIANIPMPNKSEIDVPINYADYYYVEALGRASGKLKR